MSYLVLALKWRPQTFDEVAGQEPIAQTFKNAIASNRTAHAYLFTGPRGVGKTSTARILAKALNCVEGPTPTPCNRCDACMEITGGRSLDVLEIDGASNRGIDDVRELRESVRYTPASGRTKVYIIDEVHMLTTDAFNALLKTLEEPPAHVVFVLCTTEPLKVPATIVSRCQRFDFARLRVVDTLARLRHICQAEGIAIEEDALSLIARRAEGSMRDALTLVDQVVASGRQPLDGAAVAAALGIAGRELYFDIAEAIIAQDPHRALGLLAAAYSEGQNLQEVSEALISHLRDLLVMAVGSDLGDLIDATDSERERFREQASRTNAADLLRQLHIAIDTAARMRRSAFPRVLLEVAIAEICLLPRSADLAQWIRSLPAAEAENPAAVGSPAAAGRPAAAATPPSRRAPSGRQTFASPAPDGAPPASEPPPAATGEWGEVIQVVRKKKPMLGATLGGTEVVGEQDGYLILRLPAASVGFHRSTLESAETRPVLQAAIQQVYGRPLGWRIEGSAAAEPEAKKAPARAAPQARSNLSDLQRIADQMNGEIMGPA